MTTEELDEMESAIDGQEFPYVNVDIDDYRKLIAAARENAALRGRVIDECAAIAKRCADERRNNAESQPVYTTPERSFVFESLRAKESEANRILSEILKLKK